MYYQRDRCIPKAICQFAEMVSLICPLLLITAALVRGAKAQEYTTVDLAQPGTLFEDLPYAAWLKDGNNNIELSIEVATLLAKHKNGSVIMRVNAPVYRNGATGDIAPFGPLLKLKRGERFSIKLTNNLVKQPSGSDKTQNHIGLTNFHVHGIHESTGTIDMAKASEYSGGDNVFITMNAKENETSPGESLTLFGDVSEDHLPGNHWYHAHHHLATTIQTFAAHGGILVEDDDVWLPDSQGCEDVRNVLNAADHKIMLLTIYPFTDPTVADPAIDPSSLDDTWDLANYQLVAEEGNATYCCDEDDEKMSNALYGSGTSDNLVFMNGGFQPLVSMKSGVWQRWSLALASYTMTVLMQVVDSKTQAPTEACEIMLISKDGVFPMKIPRAVAYMQIPSGGRAQVLIRCNASKGSTFDVISSSFNTPMGTGINGDPSIASQKVFSIIIENGKAEKDLKSKACTPLRPAYAADLRDSELALYNVMAQVDQIPTFTGTPPGIGCAMSGEAFDSSQKPYALPIGKVVEWQFERLAAHPLHTHINPFQIQDISQNMLKPNTSLEGGWFEAGDYYDTLLLPMVKGANATNPNVIPLRLQPGPYAGYTVTHCHFLNHEDAGCMHMMEYSCPEGSTLQGYPYTCSQAMPIPGTFIKSSNVTEASTENISEVGSPPIETSMGATFTGVILGILITLVLN